MRTPDEIKKGLECCKPIWKGDHWKNCDEKCPYYAEMSWCKTILKQDAIAYIQQLEEQVRDLTEKIGKDMNVPSWTSTQERLPEESGKYLIGCMSKSRKHFYHVVAVPYSSVHKMFNAYDWQDKGELFGYMPDYWMPMPELPKED